MAAKKSAGAKSASGTQATNKTPAKSTSGTTASKKTAAKKTPVTKTSKAVPSANGAAKKAAAKSPAAKPATKAKSPKAAVTAAPRKASTKNTSPFTKVELREFGSLIDGQLRELQAEYDAAMIALDDLQHNRLDTAGDDPADAGNKTFEREQEMSIANNRMHLITQLQRSRERINEGSYGLCENCGKTIPKARLQAYPSATLCVDCKAREERR